MSLGLVLPPIGVADLLDRWPDEPKVYKCPPTELGSTVTPEWLYEWIDTGCVPADEIAAIKAPAPALNARSWSTDGRTDAARLRRLYEQGYTIRLGNLQRVMPFMARLARGIQEETGYSNYVHAFLTPGQEQGLRHHWDQQMAVIVQIAGVKRWELWPPVVEAPMREHLESFRVWKHSYIEEWTAAGPDMVIDLEPGQSMLLPRGWVHNPFNAADEPSLHLTFAIRERTPFWIMEKLTSGAIEEVAFRQILLPVDIHGGALPGIVGATRDALVAYLRELDPGTLAERLRDLARTELEYST
ncbi:cupin domain-containing protein [Micromonospora sp. WMMD1082]|uniref:JmjC domain-containing protein n=1 Tax=Micromonospora sp. WMMD1082 TaxID=3016104 RepID=UPI00241758F2|nr:cupin domain-containing protein [Micromonospora sp. WMMD1082]MDG4792394.1 cupin domain-containing protein [Micromonospora sp. WMMD1082]